MQFGAKFESVFIRGSEGLVTEADSDEATLPPGRVQLLFDLRSNCQKRDFGGCVLQLLAVLASRFLLLSSVSVCGKSKSGHSGVARWDLFRPSAKRDLFSRILSTSKVQRHDSFSTVCGKIWSKQICSQHLLYYTIHLFPNTLCPIKTASINDLKSRSII